MEEAVIDATGKHESLKQESGARSGFELSTFNFDFQLSVS
jgi:hypothetical protein